MTEVTVEPGMFGRLDRISEQDAAWALRVFSPELSALFRTAWTAFATTGDPGRPPFDEQGRLTQIFDTPPAVTAYPEETSRGLWRHHDLTPLPLLG